MAKYLTILLLLLVNPFFALPDDDVKMHWTSLGKDADAFDSMMERAAFLDVPRRDLRAMVGNGEVTANALDRRQARARSQYWKGWVLSQSDPDSAIRLANGALELCDSVKYPYDHARFSILKADLLRFTGNYADAYFIYRDKIMMLRERGDDFWVAKSLVGIGAIMQELGEHHEALRNYREAQETFDKCESQACATKNRINLANIHYLMGDKEKCLEFLNGLESSKYVSSDSIYIANVLVSRFQISDYADKEAAHRAYEISKSLRNVSLSVITLMSMGMLAHDEGDDRNALSYLRKALDLASAVGDIGHRKQVLQAMELCYGALGMRDDAKRCGKEILLLNDSLYRQENVENLRRAEHLATINRYEARMQAEADKHKLRLTYSMLKSKYFWIFLTYRGEYF